MSASGDKAFPQEAISPPRLNITLWSTTWLPNNSSPSLPWLMMRTVSNPLRLANWLLIWLMTSWAGSKVTTVAFANSCWGTLFKRSWVMITRLCSGNWIKGLRFTAGVILSSSLRSSSLWKISLFKEFLDCCFLNKEEMIFGNIEAPNVLWRGRNNY